MAAAPNNRYNGKYEKKDIIAFGENIVKWAEETESLHLVNWSKKHKKCSQWIYWLASSYPVFDEYFQLARETLADKILTLSFYNQKVNAYTGMKYLPVYDQAYKDILKEENKNADGFKNLSDLITALKK